MNLVTPVDLWFGDGRLRAAQTPMVRLGISCGPLGERPIIGSGRVLLNQINPCGFTVLMFFVEMSARHIDIL